MVNAFSIHKETSRGLKENVANGQTLDAAQALLERIMRDYRRGGVQCSLSKDGKTVTAANSETSAFKVIYRIIPAGLPDPSSGSRHFDHSRRSAALIEA